MSNSSGIISAPVSMKDVQTVLGDSSTSLASLCTSLSISMWAKYKPVPSNEKFLDIKTGYRGKGYNCGISYSTANSVSGIRELYSQTNNGYSYERPSVYRLADFNGYNHRAEAPIQGYSFESECVNTNFTCSCEQGITTTTGDVLTIKDILNLTDDDNYYFGVGLCKGTNTTPTFFKTADTAFDYSVSFKGSTLTAGTYTVVPFLSSVKYEGINETEKAGIYVALPSITLKTVTLVTKASDLNSKISLTQGTAGNCTIKNNDTDSHVISLQLRFTSSKETDSMVIGETQLLTNVTLAAGKSKIVTFSSSMESGSSYSLWLFADYTLIKKQAVLSTGGTIPTD